MNGAAGSCWATVVPSDRRALLLLAAAADESSVMGSGTGCPNAPEMRRLNWWVGMHRWHHTYGVPAIQQRSPHRTPGRTLKTSMLHTMPSSLYVPGPPPCCFRARSTTSPAVRTCWLAPPACQMLLSDCTHLGNPSGPPPPRTTPPSTFRPTCTARTACPRSTCSRRAHSYASRKRRRY